MNDISYADDMVLLGRSVFSSVVTMGVSQGSILGPFLFLINLIFKLKLKKKMEVTFVSCSLHVKPNLF